MLQRTIHLFLLVLIIVSFLPQPTFAQSNSIDFPGDENWDNSLGNPGLTSMVNSLVIHNSTLLAGGGLGVYAWNGSNWITLGTTPGTVNTLASTSTGILYAGGNYTQIGSCISGCNHVSMYDGTGWFPLGSGMDAPVYALTLASDGTLFDGGEFSNSVAQWNGTNWLTVGRGLNSPMLALIADTNNNLYAGGYAKDYLQYYDDSGWQSKNNTDSGFDNTINALAMDSMNRLIIGGSFSTPYLSLTRYDPVTLTWSDFSFYPDGSPSSLAVDSCGGLYVGGYFSNFNSPTSTPAITYCPAIAYWDGTNWFGLGSGLGYTDNFANAQTLLFKNGMLFVGGAFDSAGGKLASFIASWTGRDCKTVADGTSTYTLYADNLPITIELVNPGSITTLRAQRFNQSHPHATLPLQTGYYWQIEALDAEGAPAEDFSLNLTLSTPPNMTADEDDKLCRHNGEGWVCSQTNHTANSLTLNNVTALSEWAIGNNAGPTAIQLKSFEESTDIDHTYTGLIFTLGCFIVILIVKRKGRT